MSVNVPSWLFKKNDILAPIASLPQTVTITSKYPSLLISPEATPPTKASETSGTLYLSPNSSPELLISVKLPSLFCLYKKTDTLSSQVLSTPKQSPKSKRSNNWSPS